MKLKLGSRAGSKTATRRPRKSVSTKSPKVTLTQTALKAFLKKHHVHPHMIKHMHASGWFSSLVSAVKKVAPLIIKHAPQIIKTGMSAYNGYKENGIKGAISSGIDSFEGGRKRKTKRKMTMTKGRKANNARLKTRGMLISKYMKKHGVLLGEASSAVSKGRK
jgi:hypothetical protein